MASAKYYRLLNSFQSKLIDFWKNHKVMIIISFIFCLSFFVLGIVVGTNAKSDVSINHIEENAFILLLKNKTSFLGYFFSSLVKYSFVFVLLFLCCSITVLNYLSLSILGYLALNKGIQLIVSWYLFGAICIPYLIFFIIGYLAISLIFCFIYSTLITRYKTTKKYGGNYFADCNSNEFYKLLLTLFLIMTIIVFLVSVLICVSSVVIVIPI